MDEAVIRANAQTIFDSGKLDDTIFTVDSTGKLDTISKFNLFGRFIHWCKGKFSEESHRDKTRRAFDETIQGMLELCNPEKQAPDTLKKNYVINPRSSSPGLHFSKIILPIQYSTKYSDLVYSNGRDTYQTLEAMRTEARLNEINI